MTEINALIIWSALIAGCVEGIKVVAKAAGRDTCPAHVRLLPVWPFILGAVSGVWVLPAVAPQWELPWGVWLCLGFGAGAVAGQSWKVVRQTLRGADLRIGGGHGRQ